MNYLIAAVLALVSSLILYILLVRNASSKSNLKTKKVLKVSFIHPDLGIGGAEKLVVEVALALQRRGHQVQIYTAFHDPSEGRCFQATRDGTLKVHVHGNFLPRHILGKFHLPCALLRFVFLSLRWLYDNWREPQDVVFVDQISATVPLLRVSGAKVLFYCHYPDQLLTKRQSVLKKLYRLPLDLLEEITTAQADQILVNSRFTASVFKDTFKHIKTVPAVLYPAVDHSNFTESDPKLRVKAPFFLSLNRFEGKKGHDLAVKALNIVRNKGYNDVKLVIAGGFDHRLQDNRDTLALLEKLVTEFKLENRVEFKPSVPDAERNTLLATCMAVLYTPINEHFGIVPLEAALSGAPVIACNSGGPLETVKDSNTGYLCPPEPEDFARAMISLLDNTQLVTEMGRNGRRHVLDNFSVQMFSDNLERLLKE